MYVFARDTRIHTVVYYPNSLSYFFCERPLKINSYLSAPRSSPPHPLQCVACGERCQSEAKLGAITRKEILRDWQGVPKGPHEQLVGDVGALGFILCGKCGLPFTAKGLGAHARSCCGTRPSRPLAPVASCPEGDGEGDHVRGERGEPSHLRSPGVRHRHAAGNRPSGGNASHGFLPPLTAAGRRSNIISPALIPGSSTTGSAAAQAL